MSDWLNRREVKAPVGAVARGAVRPPSSKSVSHRLMNLVMLGGRPAEISHVLVAEDLELFREAFRACGWRLEETEERLSLHPPTQPHDAAEIFCGNAGTMFRFLVASRAVCAGVTTIDGTARLRERPIGPLVDSLQQLGARLEFLGEPGCAPVRVWGGSLMPGTATLDASESSQYLSAMLMACSFVGGPTTVQVDALVSSPYVEVTLAAMRRAGLPLPTSDELRGSSSIWRVEGGAVMEPSEPFALEVEADYSAAAYPAAAAMISGGEVTLRGLDPGSVQGDRRFLEVLVQSGGSLRWRGADLVFAGRPSRALDVDLSSMPDQVPTLAAVAAYCPGTTRIRNVAHLRIKESDRLRAVALQWRLAGIEVREFDDGLEIEGRPEWLEQPPQVEPCRIETYDDHRIAMSAALLGLRRPLVVLEPAVVAKSYPGFWDDLFRICG